ncbi:hypothetical protein Q4555_09495 [Octadecabacter sp. 1_MG-2023]|uniref:hypothetical protein n=1 Tax=unclassified Octadecabacter TaxID=196158 RepID=UPI001C09F695|nr:MULTISPECIES: hypothetical protein [unclassified Octadecabacter]MBU2992337.1 hypothetical protein [Octadecabacter sp. B2R22]MDO6734906.1 hypothetical protein [Octadecabacter sp. 1_MG-2023]
MLTLLADAMFTATLKRRGDNIPDNAKDYADHYIPKRLRNPNWQARTHNPYRDLW